MPACMPPCLSSRLHACMPAWLSACLPACLPACVLACLLAYLPPCQPASECTSFVRPPVRPSDQPSVRPPSVRHAARSAVRPTARSAVGSAPGQLHSNDTFELQLSLNSSSTVHIERNTQVGRHALALKNSIKKKAKKEAITPGRGRMRRPSRSPRNPRFRSGRLLPSPETNLKHASTPGGVRRITWLRHCPPTPQIPRNRE